MIKRISLFALLCALGLSAGAQAANPDAGRSVYTNNCASCHATPWTTSAAAIQSAIQGNRGGMGRLSSLSAAELQDIAAYMNNPAGAATTTTTATAPASSNPAVTTTPSAASTAPTSADIDQLYDWAEATYPQLFTHHGFSQDINGYYSRYYLGANVYLLTRDGLLYFMDGNRTEGMLGLGKIADWLKRIPAKTASAATPSRESGEVGETHRDDHESGETENDHGDRDTHRDD